MPKKDIIIIGGGGHAKACIDVVESTCLYNIVGYVDKESKLNSCFNLDYLGKDDILHKYIPTCAFLIAIGQIKDPHPRINIFENMLKKGAKFPSIISPSAYVSKYAEIGLGTIVMHGAILQANVKVGNNCIINDRSLLEHDVIVGDYCHISTSATLNGAVEIGANTFIGSGSVIKNGTRINKNVIIGMGVIVLHDILEEGIFLSDYYKKNES
jgi:sugar O-acyltransferase (sialic acid O-acetyltransferase NeuD family)